MDISEEIRRKLLVYQKNELTEHHAIKTGLTIYYHQLEFRGICRDCDCKNKTQEG